MTKREEYVARRKAFFEKLESLGLSDISGYTLVNNYGYTFNYKGQRYDARHWLNVYGADVDYWDIMPNNVELNEALNIIIKYDNGEDF